MEFDEEITVYDKYTIHFSKYPRKNSDKEKTDIILILFLMHEDFLRKLCKTVEEAVQSYHDCKEYFYVFSFQKKYKKYSAQEIMNLMHTINEYLSSHPQLDIQKAYLQKCSLLDVLFYFYIRNKEFILHLFHSMEEAKHSYFQRRDYIYRLIPPNDFYSGISSQLYSAIELMEINAYTQYLVKRNIIQELPLPKYI